VDVIVNATSLLPPVTGIGRYTYNLMSTLPRLTDVKFHYIYNNVLSEQLQYGKSTAMSTVLLKKLFKTIVPQPYRVSQWLRQRAFNTAVRRYHPALYHEPNYLPLDFKGPTVVTVHDLSVIRFPESHPKDRVKQFERLLYGAVHSADAIVVDSDFIRSEVIEHFSVTPDKVFTTLLGVGQEFHPFVPDNIASTLSSYNLGYKSYLLVVGTLEPRKNLPMILGAYKALSQELRERFPLVIAGMRGWNLEQLDKDLQDMVQSGQVRLLGYVCDSELPKFYAGAKAFLFPSRYEGFGLPPLEAMASGLPVIASNRASIPEVVGDAGILLDPDDPVKWTNAMNSLLGDDEQANRMSNLSLERARTFTWERCAEQTLAAYEYALGRPIARRQ